MDQEHSIIPQPVARRLLMNFLGWRLRAGAWVRGDQLCLDEELVDRMPPKTWEASVTGWRRRGAPPCERADGHRPPAEDCPR
jgi:hypothetical protein